MIAEVIHGKHIVNTQRIPLDIKSVKIKQTAITKQYVIDISFKNSSPCRITASPKVLMIDSQKVNLPLFLEHLNNISPNTVNTNLKNISGQKIRKQYFNFTILCFFTVFLTIFAVMITMSFVGRFYFEAMIKVLPLMAVAFGICLTPLIFLSLLNKFMFGKIIGVIDENGIHLENDYIRLADIESVTYSPRTPRRYRVVHTFATIKTSKYDVDVLHFSLYALRYIKKQNPDIKIKLDKDGKDEILYFFYMPIIYAIIFSAVAYLVGRI